MDACLQSVGIFTDLSIDDDQPRVELVALDKGFIDDKDALMFGVARDRGMSLHPSFGAAYPEESCESQPAFGDWSNEEVPVFAESLVERHEDATIFAGVIHVVSI